ncbi:MAG: hypothetical protein ACYSVY_22075 [Planctomycetota bacterium]|jgi:hypothetical protein
MANWTRPRFRCHRGEGHICLSAWIGWKMVKLSVHWGDPFEPLSFYAEARGREVRNRLCLVFSPHNSFQQWADFRRALRSLFAEWNDAKPPAEVR